MAKVVDKSPSVLSEPMLVEGRLNVVITSVDDGNKPFSLVVSTFKVETELLDCEEEDKVDGIVIVEVNVEITEG